MPSDVAVYNPSPVMANNKEAVQQLERDCGDGEKVQGRDRFAMMVKKSQPALGQFWVSGCSLHPTGDASLGYLEAEHEPFAVDARSTPGGVLGCHAEDQIPHLAGDPPSTRLLSDFREHAPVHAKTRTMPAAHRFRERPPAVTFSNRTRTGGPGAPAYSSQPMAKCGLCLVATVAAGATPSCSVSFSPLAL